MMNFIKSSKNAMKLVKQLKISSNNLTANVPSRVNNPVELGWKRLFLKQSYPHQQIAFFKEI